MHFQKLNLRLISFMPLKKSSYYEINIFSAINNQFFLLFLVKIRKISTDFFFFSQKSEVCFSPNHRIIRIGRDLWVSNLLLRFFTYRKPKCSVLLNALNHLGNKKIQCYVWKWYILPFGLVQYKYHDSNKIINDIRKKMYIYTPCIHPKVRKWHACAILILM